jgi:DNA-binding SARP family transcriptional activator
MCRQIIPTRADRTAVQQRELFPGEVARERLSVDVDLFESHASQGLEAVDGSELPAAQHHLDHANALYRGDFLADEPFADWALAERERLHEIASTVLRALADIAAQQSNYSRASAHLGRLAALQPFDVEVHRDVIAMCLRRGRKSEAMRRYSALRARLRRQFGEELDFTISELQEKGEPRPWPVYQRSSSKARSRRGP